MYFDPGMGSLIIQTVIAVLAVAGGYFAAMKLKVKRLFKKDEPKETEEAQTASGTDDDTL